MIFSIIVAWPPVCYLGFQCFSTLGTDTEFESLQTVWSYSDSIALVPTAHNLGTILPVWVVAFGLHFKGSEWRLAIGFNYVIVPPVANVTACSWTSHCAQGNGLVEKAQIWQTYWFPDTFSTMARSLYQGNEQSCISDNDHFCLGIIDKKGNKENLEYMAEIARVKFLNSACSKHKYFFFLVSCCKLHTIYSNSPPRAKGNNAMFMLIELA